MEKTSSKNRRYRKFTAQQKTRVGARRRCAGRTIGHRAVPRARHLREPAAGSWREQVAGRRTLSGWSGKAERTETDELRRQDRASSSARWGARRMRAGDRGGSSCGAGSERCASPGPASSSRKAAPRRVVARVRGDQPPGDLPPPEARPPTGQRRPADRRRRGGPRDRAREPDRRRPGWSPRSPRRELGGRSTASGCSG